MNDDDKINKILEIVIRSDERSLNQQNQLDDCKERYKQLNTDLKDFKNDVNKKFDNYSAVRRYIIYIGGAIGSIVTIIVSRSKDAMEGVLSWISGVLLKGL